LHFRKLLCDSSVKQYYAQVSLFRQAHPVTTALPVRDPKVPFRLAAVVGLLLAWTCVASPRLIAQDVSAAPAPQVDLSDEISRDVLSNFQRAVEGRNLVGLLATFDADATPDFPQIRDQFVAFFGLHDNIRFRYQILQATDDKGVAFAIADVDMDAQPADVLPTERRRSAQMRFQMKRTPKGWRLTGLKPMDFFSN
jgi:hypothetical protein